MGRIFLTWTGCGGFEVRTDHVNFAFDPYKFGKDLDSASPDFDFIFISHEHFDHCHPKTLQQFSQGDRIKQILVSPGCCNPDEPVDEKYGDVAFERDLPITKHVDKRLVDVAFPKYLSHVGGEDRSFPDTGEWDFGTVLVEVIESGENQHPYLPTCGYLVTIPSLEVSFLHTGDLTVPYPALEKLGGRVTYLIHMKMGLTEYGAKDQSEHLIRCIDLIRPEYLIPTHYRTDRSSDPIPHGTRPPDVTEANAFIEWIRATVGGQTQVLPFTAGVTYEVDLPSKQVQWKWKTTWEVPPWRNDVHYEPQPL